nr:hydroxyacid oxidase 2-like [Meriones unguiculatus]
MPLVCLEDFKAYARQQLSKSYWDYIEGEADEGITRNDNIAAFKRIRLRPRYLRDVSNVDTRTTIQGQEISAPICISPSAYHSIAWSDGERSTARAAQEVNICYITSTYTSCTLEDIVAAAPGGLRWFQLSVQTDWELNKRLVQKAEALGFKALVITVDAPVIGNRRQNMRNQLNMEAKIMLKDLRSPEEEIHAHEKQAEAMCAFLSQIDALTEVVAAVKGKIEVYMDGGVRTGSDVLKALALGARCIFLGRPILWALTCKGEHGVKEVLNILKAELHTSMALSGCRSVAEISSDLIQFYRV